MTMRNVCRMKSGSRAITSIASKWSHSSTEYLENSFEQYSPFIPKLNVLFQIWPIDFNWARFG
jgi:hypothetical protein